MRTTREGPVAQIVQRTRAIQWWIDKQIEHGKTDEQIEVELPVAVAFITGRIGMPELLDLRQAAAQTTDDVGDTP